MLLMLLIMATSPLGLSKLWGGGIPTSYIDHSGPMLRRLLLCSLLIGLTPPYSPFFAFSASQPSSYVLPPHGIHCPLGVTRLCPSIPKNLPLLSLTGPYQIPTPTLLPHPHHAFQVTVTVAPTLLQKYLLTWPSYVVLQPPVTTTARATSPLPRIPSPFHGAWILVVGPPNPLPFSAYCWCITKEVLFLSSKALYLSPPFAKSRPLTVNTSYPSPAAGNPHVPPWSFAAFLPSTSFYYILTHIPIIPKFILFLVKYVQVWHIS